MNCNHVEDLLPAYALGALEPEEHHAVEEHLDECPYCKPVAREYLEATAALAAAVPPATPPPGLRNQILSAAGRQVPNPAPLAFPGNPSGDVLSRRSMWGTAGFAVAAGLGLVFIGVLLGMVLDMRREVRDLRDESRHLVAMINDQRTFAYTAALPGTDAMPLENTGQAPKARGMLMISQDRTWGILVSQGLAPFDTMGYQVWLIKNGERTSGGIFKVDDTGYGQFYIRFPAPLGEFAQVGITMEPEEGSPNPTSEPVLTGHFQLVSH